MPLHYFSIKEVAFPLGRSHFCNEHVVLVESTLPKAPKVRPMPILGNHEQHAPIGFVGIEPGHAFVHC
jgi:hypothetical protein